MKTLRNIILGLTLAGTAMIGVAAEKEEEAPPPRRNITTMTEIFSDLPVGEVGAFDTRQQFTSIYLDYEHEPGRYVPAIAHLIFQNMPSHEELGRGDICNVSIYSLPDETRLFEMKDFNCDGYNNNADSFYDFRAEIHAGSGSTEEELDLAYNRETLVLSSVKKAKKANKISERVAARKKIFDGIPSVHSDEKIEYKQAKFEFYWPDENGIDKLVKGDIGLQDKAPIGVYQKNESCLIRFFWKDTNKLFLGLRTHIYSNFSESGDSLYAPMYGLNVNENSSVDEKKKAIDLELDVYQKVLEVLK